MEQGGPSESPIQEGFPDEGNKRGAGTGAAVTRWRPAPHPELREGLARGARLGQGEAGSSGAGFLLLSLGALSRTRLQG